MFFLVFDILFSKKDICYRVQNFSRQKYPNKFSYIWHWKQIDQLLQRIFKYKITLLTLVSSRENLHQSRLCPPPCFHLHKNYPHPKNDQIINRGYGSESLKIYEVPGKDKHKYLNLIATLRITRHTAKFSCILLFLNIVYFTKQNK